MVDPSAQSRRPQHQLRRLDSPPFPVRLDPPFSRHPRVLRSAVHRLRSPRCNGDPFRAEQMAGRSGNGRKRGQIVRFHDHFLCAVPRAGVDARRAGGGAGRTALRCLPAGRQSERRSPLACQRVPATGGPRHAESERGSFADRPMLGPLALPPPVRMGERGAEEWEVP